MLDWMTFRKLLASLNTDQLIKLHKDKTKSRRKNKDLHGGLFPLIAIAVGAIATKASIVASTGAAVAASVGSAISSSAVASGVVGGVGTAL